MAKSKTPTVPVRVAADVSAAAVQVAPAEHRTVTEQVNYWARIGMQIERSTSLEGRRLRQVAAGEAQFSTLSPQERAVAHATIDARTAERAAAERFGPAARVAGQTTVSIDHEGHLIEIAPDGTRRRL